MYRSPEFEAFIAPARHYPQFWRIVIGLLLALVVYMVPILAGFMIVGLLFPDSAFVIQEILENANTPLAMLVLLSTFLFMGAGAVAAASVHSRGLASLIGPFRPACRNFSRAIIGVVAIYAISIAIISFIMPKSPTPNLALSEWLTFLPIMIPLLLIQTGAEELIFRGYLMQQLAARFKSAVIWMGVPTILFGLAHYDSTIDPTLALLFITATGFFGFVAADLTRVTGNLGAAIGFHFTNNFFALFLVAVADQMSGLSLFHAPFTMKDVDVLVPLILADMVTVFIVWRLLLRWLTPAR